MSENSHWGAVLALGLILALAACMPDVTSGEATATAATFVEATATTSVEATAITSVEATATTSVEATAVPTSGPSTEEPAGEMVLYPEELGGYQAYLDVIGGRPGLADTAVIEATITSILKGEICPYQEEVCRIEPYPDDWGTVRVDKIVEYAPPGGSGNTPLEAEASGTPAGTMSGSEVQTSPQTMGAGVQAGPAKYEPLQAGQEVQALFLLTARPARVRHLTGTAYEGAEAAQPSGVDAGQVVAHQGEPGELTFEPIPREGDYFLFSTLATDAGDSGELVLPGLDAGSRFRARVQYDGTLYVQEYEVIP